MLTKTLAIRLACVSLLFAGCATIHYQEEVSGYTVQNTGGWLSGEPTYVNPAIIEYLVASEQTNLPLYYERIASWSHNPPESSMMDGVHKVAIDDFMKRLGTLNTHPDLAEEMTPALAEDLKDDKMNADADLKLTGRIFARMAGFALAPYVDAAVLKDGHASIMWGHKIDDGSVDLKMAGNIFEIAADPEAQTVSVYGGRPHSTVAMGEAKVYDVSAIEGAFECRDASGSVVAIDFDTYAETAPQCTRLPFKVVAEKIKLMTEE